MKKTLFLASLALAGAACAAEYEAYDASSFQAAWDQAGPGDVICVADDIDFSDLAVPLSDKTGSVRVESKNGKIIHWSSPGDAEAGSFLPAGFVPQGVTIVNAPGTLLEAKDGSQAIAGEGTQFVQSQGGDAVIVAASGGMAAVEGDVGFTGLVSSGNGGAIRVEDGGSAMISGGVEFRDNAAAGSNLGGAIYVAGQSGQADEEACHLTLASAKGQDIVFSGNQSEAAPRDGGEGSVYWEGFSNDVFLGSNARMLLDAGADSSILLNGGVESADDGSAAIVKTGKGQVVLGEGSFYSGSLLVEEGKAAIAGGVTWGDGSDSVEVSEAGALELGKGATLSGGVSLQGALAAAGDATLEQALAIAGEAASVSVGSGARLDVVGGLASDGDEVSLAKNGAGALRLKGASDYAGGLVVKEGSVVLLEGSSLGKAQSADPKPVVIEKGADFVLQAGSALNAPLDMNGGELIVQAPASLSSQSVTLGKDGGTWTFDMKGISRQEDAPALTLNPDVVITPAPGGSLTLNFANIESIREGADSIYVINISDLNDEESKALLARSKVTYTDASGTVRQTAARLDAETGVIRLDDLLVFINTDRPGRAAVNALWSSAGALRGFGAALRGQMPLHHAPQAGSAGMQAWASGLGYYENAGGAWRYSGGGFAVGATCAFGSQGAGEVPETLLGVALGWMGGSNKARFSGSSDADAKTDQDALMFALYGRKILGHSSYGAPALDFTLAYGRVGNDFASSSHSGSWDDDVFHVSARYSWECRDSDGVCCAPFIGLEFTAAEQDSAAFGGRDGGWRSDGADLNVLSLPVGVSICRSFEAGGGKVFTPQLEILYRGDLSRSNPSAAIADGYSSWTANGDSPARSAFEARGTLHLQITETWAAWATYGLEARSGDTAQRFSVGTSFAF